MQLGHVKAAINAALGLIGLRLVSVAAQRAEDARVRSLADAGHFDVPVFPVPDCVRRCDPAPVLQWLPRYADRFETFESEHANPVRFSFANAFYKSPDAEVLYAFIRELKPRHIVEVGCGNSTRIMRQAVTDGALPTTIRCIDPEPRADVSALADEIERRPVEAVEAEELLRGLAAGDLLFIDSSHVIRTGGDVTHLVLRVLPQAPAGLLVHFHDVFLPCDYPRSWVAGGWGWTEQYLLQGVLQFGNDFEVLWAGQYHQRTQPGFAAHFPHMTAERMAASLWLRKLR